MLGDIGEAGWVGVGEGLDEGGVDEGEDGNAGSDAEREHEDGGDGEAGAAAELAEGVADVLDHGLEEGDGAAFAVGLLGWFGAA